MNLRLPVGKNCLSLLLPCRWCFLIRSNTQCHVFFSLEKKNCSHLPPHSEKAQGLLSIAARRSLDAKKLRDFFVGQFVSSFLLVPTLNCPAGVMSETCQQMRDRYCFFKKATKKTLHMGLCFLAERCLVVELLLKA